LIFSSLWKGSPSEELGVKNPGLRFFVLFSFFDLFDEVAVAVDGPA
jgi:hypothetical protein